SGRESRFQYATPQGYASELLAEGGWRPLPVLRDQESFNLSPVGLSRLLAGAEKPSVAFCRHINGVLPRMDEIVALCKTHGVLPVEDMGGLLGASLHGKKMGDFDSVAFLDCSSADAMVPLWDTTVFFLTTIPPAHRKAVEKLFSDFKYSCSAETGLTIKIALSRVPALVLSRQAAYGEYAGFFASLSNKKWQVQKVPFGVIAAPDSFCFMPVDGNENASAAFAEELLRSAQKALDGQQAALLQRRLCGYGGGILSVPLDIEPRLMFELLRPLFQK
ncbi:MAG TPA: DegT/DnrJ/EryC1/StrS family aminotransferase, partial [Elusimicrobiales bacterium]|nr:DegT/DnrJ/EryC1/StrS family aminotransferase [Elusimicrobiales bacterium]